MKLKSISTAFWAQDDFMKGSCILLRLLVPVICSFEFFAEVRILFCKKMSLPMDRGWVPFRSGSKRVQKSQKYQGTHIFPGRPELCSFQSSLNQNETKTSSTNKVLAYKEHVWDLKVES